MIVSDQDSRHHHVLLESTLRGLTTQAESAKATLLTVGTLAVTVVPSAVEVISNFPPSCRKRSFIPRKPTPSDPSQSSPASSNICSGMPLPWSRTSKTTLSFAVLSETV